MPAAGTIPILALSTIWVRAWRVALIFCCLMCFHDDDDDDDDDDDGVFLASQPFAYKEGKLLTGFDVGSRWRRYSVQ